MLPIRTRQKGHLRVAKRSIEAEGEPAPKRRRGAPKGRPKPPGSGRKASVKNWTATEVRNEILPAAAKLALSILNGEPQLTSGPTGKDRWMRPTIDHKIKAMENSLKKVLPDLSATAVTGLGEQVPGQTVDNSPDGRRKLARVILGHLSAAELAPEPEEEPPAPPSRPGPLLLERSPIIEVSYQNAPSPGVSETLAASGGEASVDAVSSPPDAEPTHGERIVLDSNGAEIAFDTERGKWQVLGFDGTCHTWKRSKAEAIAKAQSLPGPSLMSSPGRDHPRDPIDYMGQPEQRPFAPRGPRVLRRAPR